ncbi:MAG: ABC transporter permease [Candidatus Latescibacteria bacterium]|nr:ABC transporter permease [Candidatus Latescibacterota bacterium]
MLRNYLTIAWRNLVRHKLYSLINVLGLATGMAACLLIVLFVQDELRYDQFHEQAPHIYRVLQGGSARTSYPVGEVVRDQTPEVEEMVRISTKWQRLVSYGEKRFEEVNFLYADPSFFSVFSFPLVKGDAKTALVRPFSIVITREMAQKYCGDEDPVGKVLRIDHERDYTITGVLEPLPRQSHFTFDFLATFVGSEAVFYEDMLEHWGVSNFYTYLRLREGSNLSGLEKKMTALIAPLIRAKHPELTPSILLLQPLKDIHLHSAHLWGDIEPQGNITYVYVFSAIAVFILLIACINFTNLATARAVERMREVGVRKVAGARRQQLMGQFIGESILLALTALLVALALIEVGLPAFNVLLGKRLSLAGEAGWGTLSGLVAMVLGVGLAAGSYPAIYLSALQPVEVLKGKARTGKDGVLFRRVLVVVQFSISITLIVGVGIIYSQMEYMRNKDLGFDKEHLAVVEIPGNKDNRQSFEVIKAQVLQYPGIMSVSASSDVPPDSYFRSAPVFPNETPERTRWARIISANYGLLETLSLGLVAGRSFSPDFRTDEKETLILSESAVAALGWASPEEALGQRCEIDGTRTVVGVVRDFHFESLHARIEPVVFELDPGSAWLLVVRIRGGQIPETLDFLKEKWGALFPEWPFEYRFVDQSFDQEYRAEARTERIAVIAALLTLSIACLGVFGLTAFTASRRTKEIGIRKVLGASVTSIVVLMSREFTWLVLIANLVAWPLAYLVMGRWLQNFAYQIELGPEVFVLGGVLALAIAWLTVSYQAIRAARANPVEALRYE